MKRILMLAMAAALWSGCTHDGYRGGVQNDTSFETGTVRDSETIPEREMRDYDPAPTSPSWHRDFPGRVGPGQTGSVSPGRFDPYIPR
jgi:hypothetical protein